MNKDFILNNIARINANDLFAAIQEGVVTFDELKGTMRFTRDKQDEVNRLLNAENQTSAEDEAAWAKAKAEDTIEAYQRYIRQFNKYADNARNKILFKEQSVGAEKRRLLMDMRSNPHNYSKRSIEDLLGMYGSHGRLNKEDLINEGLITRDGLEIFLNPPPFHDEQYGWSDLAPLKKDRTDIYFFGIPSSGKSCLMAGVLQYLHKNGLLKLDTNNIKGRQYANALLSLINSNSIGYVPPSTTTEGANYIEAEFRRKEGHNTIMHPINILEMSGELFVQTYKQGTTRVGANGVNTIGANQYLSNDNRKFIFLIVDYKETVTPMVTQSMAKQALQLETILDFLDKDGTLSKTDALHIVLTKSDLLPGGAQDLKGAEAFIAKEYNNLRASVKQYKEKYGFRDSRIIPFSLGHFMLDKVFEYDPTCSETIYNAITASTFVKPKPNRFKLW